MNRIAYGIALAALTSIASYGIARAVKSARRDRRKREKGEALRTWEEEGGSVGTTPPPTGPSMHSS